ncbi:MAG: sulfite exporter TauE/SafE family protein [Chromatiales bacterium]
MTLLAYLLLGAIAGFLGGLLGLGGGIIVVPALYFLFRWLHFAPELTMHLAIGTSLGIAAFTAATSTWAHHRRAAVAWSAVRALTPGILAGGLVAGLLADRVPGNALRIFFGLFEIVVAGQLLWGLSPKPTRTLPALPWMAVTGTGIGALSAVLGIGGGTMTVPFLVWCNVGIRQAVATSAACGLPITIAGALGHILAGWGHELLLGGATGYVYWPAVAAVAAISVLFAPLGARVAHAIPTSALKRVFAVVVALIGVRMLLG